MKMITTYKKYRPLLILVFGFLFSCNNFTETDLPNSQLTSSTVFVDKKTTEAALLNIYAGIRDNGMLTGTNAGLSVLMGVYTDELVFYSNSLPSQREFYVNAVVPQNEIVQNLWNQSYNQLYKINAFLEGVRNSATLDDNYKSSVIAEALTLRGFLYFYLYQLYGSVPYVTGTNYLQNQSVSRDPVEVVRSKIEQDLDDAHQAFIRTSIKNPKTRISLYALESIMAKYFLSVNNWDKAWFYSNEVILKSGAVLETNLNNEFKKDSKSSIWQFSPNVATGNSVEAGTFLINATPPSFVSLSPLFVNGFQAADQRRTLWIKTVGQGQNLFYQPNKYKIPNPATESVENTMVIRLAELYLIRAEANFKIGQSNLSVNDINVIRNRAGLPSVTAVSDDLIHQERWKELFTEFGVRFFDLKRKGRLDDLKPVKSNWNSYQQNLPIPEKELILNPKLLPQNAGY